MIFDVIVREGRLGLLIILVAPIVGLYLFLINLAEPLLGNWDDLNGIYILKGAQ